LRVERGDTMNAVGGSVAGDSLKIGSTPFISLAFCLLIVCFSHAQVLQVTNLDEPVSLAGPWNFLLADNLQYADPAFDDSQWKTLNVPVPWGKQGYYAKSGIAWYRLKLQLAKESASANQEIGIAIGKVADSYELYVNGKLLGRAGSLPPKPQVDYDREKTYIIPGNLLTSHNPVVICLRVWKDRTTSPLDGGPFEGSFQIGPSVKLVRSEILREIPPIIFVVLFVLVAFNHLKLYRSRRELKQYLWFGLMALDMAIYTFLRSQWKYEVSQNFLFMKDLEYVSLYLMPPLFIEFLWPLLNRPIGRLLRTHEALSLALVFLVIILPGVAFNVRSLYWWELFALPVIIGALYLVLLEAWRGHPEARTLAVGIFLVLVASLNDIAVDRSLLFTPRLVTFGFGAFLFSMLISLDNRFTRLYSEVDQFRQELETRVAKRTAELAAANQLLNEMDALKTKFFSNISHEFRTPLTLTIGPIDNALAGNYGELSGQLRQHLEMVLRNSRRLLGMINELLDISKLEAGKMQLRPKRINLRKLLNEITSLFISYAEKRKIELVVHSEREDLEVYLDQEKFEKICHNLLSNSFKFVDVNGKIRVSILEQGEEVILSFKDNGRGIPKKELPIVFDRFHQVDSVVGSDQPGTGIGLSLVKDLVELHHGTITVESEQGWGTEFFITLKKGNDHLKPEELIEQESEQTVERIKPVSFAADAAEQTNMNESVNSLTVEDPLLLIVDDSKDVRDYVKSCLDRKYRVEEASDGKQALEVARSAHPDLIISDVMMPQMDGYQLCKALKSEPKLSHIPIVLLTAKASEEMKVVGLEAGADDYLSKPFHAKELAARVRNLLQIHRQEKQLKTFNQELENRVREQVQALLKSKRLARYLPSKLVQKIITDEGDLASERRNMTIFFTDLTNFSDLSDRSEPEIITEILNSYFGEMVKLIEKHGGTLGRFMGDGILGFFGAPDSMDPKDQALKAVHMAVEMQQAMKEFSAAWLEKGIDHNLKIRIGIHQDYVTVGNFGSSEIVEYTVIGKGANLASRLEATCTPGQIHVSFPVYSLTKHEFSYGQLMESEFKGFSRAVRTCELDPDSRQS